MAPDAPREDPVQQAIAAEEMRGLALAMRARLAGLAVFAIWVLIENPFQVGLWYLLLIASLAASGSLPLFVERRRLGLGWLYVQAVVDVVVVAVGVFVPNPFDIAGFPVQMQLRFSNELYLFGLLSLSVFGYSPRLVLWTGFVGVLVWSCSVLWVLSLPNTIADFDLDEFMISTLSDRIALVLDPMRVLVGVTIRQMLVVVVVAIALAVAVARSRRLVVQQASAERERANLSRYFSPKLVDDLARQGTAIGETRRHEVLVLFADLAGFTTFAAEERPENVIELLREYHRRVTRAVFENDGALDEYLGDGVMATFGNPEASGTDAVKALRTGQTIVREIDAWSREREAAGEPELRVRVGIHRGPVVTGNVGEEQLKFAVVGDAVNVASRLQELAKELGTALVVSDQALTAARAEGLSEAETSNLADAGEHTLRGRGGTIRVWAST